MRWIGAVGVGAMWILVGAGCGGGPSSSAPSNAPAPANVGTVRPITQAQLDVAHYRSTDGVYGLIFDRSGGTAKAKVDGTTDVIELTRREDRVTRSGQGPAGSLLGYVFLKPDGTRLLYVTAGGGVIFFHGDDDHDMLSDATAAPLGAATIAGKAPEPKQEKSPAQQLADTLRATSIRAKQTQYSSDDAADLTKVGAAIAAADASSFFSFVANEDHHGKFAPVPKNWQDAFMAQKPASSKTGMGKFNATLFPFLELNDDHTELKIAGLQASRAPEAPADKTPGVLWEVIDDGAVFVTLDGGRYLIDVTTSGGAPLVPGLAPMAQWPAPLQHSALGPASVQELVEQAVLPRAMGDEVTAAQDDWRACAKSEVPKVKGLLEAIDRENLTYGTKVARKKAALEKWESTTTAKCAAKQAKMEKIVVASTEARNTARLGLLDKSKARVAALKLAR